MTIGTLTDGDLQNLLLIAVVASAYFVPTIVAFSRSHHYKWPICALNLAGFTGFAWVAALVWAVWPRKTTVIDVIAQPLVDPKESHRYYSSISNNKNTIARRNSIDLKA